MAELEPLIADLALILICAGAMTLLFKRLKQPVVLGYIVAGFIASPNMPYMPSVTDLEGIHLWSDIGVIFLLFALGLEFSFKKILKMGTAPIIAACSIIFVRVGTFTNFFKSLTCILSVDTDNFCVVCQTVCKVFFNFLVGYFAVSDNSSTI